MSKFFIPLLFALLALSSCTVPLRKKSLLVIGDSNGAVEPGWVTQLQKIRGGGPLVNTSLGGNTLGFTGAEGMSRNSLENLTPYLRKGYAEMGEIDEILIGLGTNDCKIEFSDRHDQIIDNLKEMLLRIRSFFGDRGQEVPRIVLLTPPALADDDKVIDLFAGSRECIAEYTVELRALAAAEGLCLVDLQRTPGDALLQYSEDGIHFNEQGYRLMARQVVEQCY